MNEKTPSKGLTGGHDMNKGPGGQDADEIRRKKEAAAGKDHGGNPEPQGAPVSGKTPG